MSSLIVKFIIGMAIAGAVMAAEHLLSAKLKNPLWGGIIPLVVLGVTVWLFAGGILPPVKRNFFPFILLILFTLGDWIAGRETYKKNLLLEVDKMKAQDI